MNTRHLRLILFVFLVGILSTGGCENGSGVAGNNARLLPAPNIEAPLVRILELDTDVPTRVRVEITEGTDMWTHEYSQFDTFHLLPVLRFRAGKEHSVLVQTIDQQGNLNSESLLTVLADPLPQDFPVYSVSANPDMMEPGVTLFAVGSYLVAMDEVGEVVWFYRIQRLSSLDRDVRRMSNGNLLLLLPPQNMNEIDMLGNVVRSWHAAGTSDGSEGSIPVDVLGFHHEVFEMQNGNLLTLSFELRQLENYPSSVIDPLAPLETANVVGDVIVEFDPSGEIINEWSLLDVLDPYRLGYTSLQGIYDTFFEENLGVEPPTRDWSHGNGVIHDPRDDSFIVSLRHQDAVIKIDRQTGVLKWILGPHANWRFSATTSFKRRPVFPVSSARTDDNGARQYIVIR